MLSSEESLKILKETNALSEGHFILSSGLHSAQYVQCAQLMSKPNKAIKLCNSLSERITNEFKNFDLILSPAIGGIVIGYEIGRLLKKETIFSERVDGKLKLRRDFSIERDQKILIVEGNNREDSKFFIKVAGASAADNLKNLILEIESSSNIEIINPNNDNDTTNALKNMSKYNGIIFTGGAMRINDMTDVIKKHINFASNCFNQKKKILAICWGLQVCSTAAGGKVNPGLNGAHIGIASDVIINEDGDKHFIYKNKKKKFTTPAFNFDEVIELPKNSILLSSDSVNKVMGVSFKAGNSEITGLQYHPDYEYHQMINLIVGRKERLFNNKNFLDEDEYEKHISYIKSENALLNFNDRSCEVRNWLNHIK